MTANQLIQKLQSEVAKLPTGDVPIKIDGRNLLDADLAFNTDENGLYLDVSLSFFSLLTIKQGGLICHPAPTDTTRNSTATTANAQGIV